MNSRKRSLGGSGVILIVLIYMLGTIAPIPAWAQGPEVVLYQEDFDDQAQGWELEPGWQVIQDGDNRVLAGEGHQWARPGGNYGSDFRVQFRLKLVGGRIHLVYRLNQTGRYFIGFHEGGSDLNKQYWPDTFLHGLAGSATPHELGGWHQVEIVGQGARLRFLVDGQVEWEYTDRDPLLVGSFAFETLDDSVAYVDDILVYGPAPVLSEVEGPTSAAVAAAPTAPPQRSGFPPKPTSEPQARGGICGGGICPSVAALPLAVASLAWTCHRRTGDNLMSNIPFYPKSAPRKLIIAYIDIGEAEDWRW